MSLDDAIRYRIVFGFPKSSHESTNWKLLNELKSQGIKRN